MNKTPLLQRDGTRKLFASLISIFIGLLFGSILVFIVGKTSDVIENGGEWDGIKLVFLGLFNTGRDASGTLTWGFNSANIGNMLFRAMPLILTGLSVAISQKTGLFNIGAAGQYLMGTMVSLMIALSIPSSVVPPAVIWILAFLGGMIAGALWGAIPGALKAFLNINEVLACIMTNWIAANVVTWLFDISRFSCLTGTYTYKGMEKVLDGGFKNLIEGTKTDVIYKTTYNNVATPKLGLDKLFPGSQINAGILLAIILAIVVFIVINKTTFGFQLKACGSNRHAARYAGIADKRNIVFSMSIAGALAAAGGALYYLSGNTEFSWQTYQQLPSEGFNGIAVALLAVNNPIGVIFSGIFMAMLAIVGLMLKNQTAYNEYITDIIISVIVYLSAFSLVIQMMLNKRSKKTVTNDANAISAADEEKDKAARAAVLAKQAEAEAQTPLDSEETEKGGAE